MNFIEIDSKLINLDNVTLIEFGSYNSKYFIYVYLKDSPIDSKYLCFKFNVKEICIAEYNRIKSILLGDDNE